MKPSAFVSGLVPLLFGYDFFISYRRDDAAAYAELLNVSHPKWRPFRGILGAAP